MKKVNKQKVAVLILTKSLFRQMLKDFGVSHDDATTIVMRIDDGTGIEKQVEDCKKSLGLKNMEK